MYKLLYIGTCLHMNVLKTFKMNLFLLIHFLVQNGMTNIIMKSNI